MGAHSFQVYLDDKLVNEQYVRAGMTAPKITINPAEHHQTLVIKYNECGKTVTGRKISIKDDRGNLLKEWKFDGTTSGYKDSMTCDLKDVVKALQKTNNPASLYYSSNDFSAGQQVATLALVSI